MGIAQLLNILQKMSGRVKGEPQLILSIYTDLQGFGD